LIGFGGEIMENEKTSLGSKLETLRKGMGLTQKDVADILKINRTTYTKYETGVTEPNIAALKKLTEIFGVDLNYLLSENTGAEVLSDNTSEDVKAREFLRLFNLLSEKDKEKLIEQMKKRTDNAK
jgi:transcriptional regulator with XRE-family HTH domain